MALCADTSAKSLTALSENPVYHYQYSSITDALHNMAQSEEDLKALRPVLTEIMLKYLKKDFTAYPSIPDAIIWQTDSTSIVKPHSDKLAQRSIVKISNSVIPYNLPLSIGYEVSYVNLANTVTSFSTPLHIERVRTNETATQCVLRQIASLLKHKDFSNKLIINLLDSKYGNTYYIGPAHEVEDLANIIRLRRSMKVWTKAETNSKKFYGEKLYLIPEDDVKEYKKHRLTGLPYEVERTSIFTEQISEQQTFYSSLKNGREIKVELTRFNDVLLRGKDGIEMKDKPFDIVCVRVFCPKSGKMIFKKEMYLALTGKHKDSITLSQVYELYLHRYDIEPYFRFAKQNMLLQNYQTPDVQHFDNYLLVQQLAAVLLHLASYEADFKPKKWQKYSKVNKGITAEQRLTVCQTKQAVEDLLLTFDSTPFLPGRSKVGRPRRKGEIQPKRPDEPYVKKTKSSQKRDT